MSKIARDSKDLRARASRMDVLADGVVELGYRLDSSVRPARRPDVPELGEIEGIYGHLRQRVSLAASNVRIEARRLRELANRQDYIEALGLAHLKGLVVRAEAVPRVPGATFARTKLGADLTLEGLKRFVVPISKLDLATDSGWKIVGSAFHSQVSSFSTFLGVAFDVEQTLNLSGKHTTADRLAGGASLVITGAKVHPLAQLTYAATYEYSKYTNDRFDANDEAGRSNFQGHLDESLHRHQHSLSRLGYGSWSYRHGTPRCP